jgi:hypothetical protein
MAVVEIRACTDLFWCRECTPKPTALQGTDAIRGPHALAPEHSRATGHKAKAITGFRMVVDRCTNCGNTGMVTHIEATMGSQAREVERHCEECFYDVGQSWQ